MDKKYRADVFEASDNCDKSKIRYVIKNEDSKERDRIGKKIP